MVRSPVLTTNYECIVRILYEWYIVHFTSKKVQSPAPTQYNQGGGVVLIKSCRLRKL